LLFLFNNNLLMHKIIRYKITQVIAKITQKNVIKAIVYSAITTLVIKQAILFSTGINILSVELFAPLVPLYDKLVSIFGFFFIALNNVIINIHFKDIFKLSITVPLTINGPEVINISNYCNNNGEGSSKNVEGDSGSGPNGNNNNNDNSKNTGNEHTSTTNNPETEKQISVIRERILELEERQQVLFRQLTDPRFSNEVYQEAMKEHPQNSRDINSLINQLDKLKLKDKTSISESDYHSKLEPISEKSSNSETSSARAPSRSPSPDLPYEGKGKRVD
jgi:hypothetical protein